MPWVTNTTFNDKLLHSAFYAFKCQHCGREAESVQRIFTGEYEVVFSRSGSSSTVSLEAVDEAAFAQTLKSKLATQAIAAWVAAERGEYDWEADCPHCGAKQQWVPKKKLFGKSAPMDPGTLPTINWAWASLGSEMPSWIESVRQNMPGLFTEKGLLKPEYSEAQNAELNWPFVQPGLRQELVKGLMGNDHPLEAMKYQTASPKNAPATDEGEIGWGFVGLERNMPVERWAILKDGRVIRASVVRA